MANTLMTEAEKVDFYRTAYEGSQRRAEALEKSNTALYEREALHTEAYGMVCQERDTMRAHLSEALVALHHIYVNTGQQTAMRPLIDKLDAALRPSLQTDSSPK